MPVSATNTATAVEDFDALIIGAGMAGLCALYRLRQIGLSVHALETAPDVGGVWYWNRYPGARFDSESYTYCYSFSRDLLDDWNWQERFAAQPEVLAYLNHVADRFDLRRHIDFETPVVSARYRQQDGTWLVETEAGKQIRCRFLVTATGPLAVSRFPEIEGFEDFGGECYHTGRWPHRGVVLAGKRVGIIGTGASGVQVIQTIAADVDRLTVFQRTPTYCIPQRNGPLDEGEREDIRRNYGHIFARCRDSFAGFIHSFDPRSGLEVSEQERQAKFEELWQQPGFAFWFGNFIDLMMDPTVNEYACEFLRGKIMERVRDPETARKLLPDHPFGTKRVPLENGYYEVYNRDNVELVDLRETPIQRITSGGIRTTSADYPLDVIICATGFDAVTGSLAKIDIRGLGDQSLSDKWRQGPKTCLGLQVAGFPNLFTLAGPHNAASLCNAVRCTEQNVDWVADCILYMRNQGYTRVVATAEAEADWTQHVNEVAGMTLLDTMTESWFYSAKQPGQERHVLVYAGGANTFRKRCDEEARRSYPGFEFS